VPNVITTPSVTRIPDRADGETRQRARAKSQRHWQETNGSQKTKKRVSTVSGALPNGMVPDLMALGGWRQSEYEERREMSENARSQARRIEETSEEDHSKLPAQRSVVYAVVSDQES